YGEANNNSGAVEGDNFNPAGGAGVIGSGAWGFYTLNNVYQGRSSGGWVKAMIVYDDVIQGKMLRCFNSTLPGAAATTVPCGFTTSFFATGVTVSTSALRWTTVFSAPMHSRTVATITWRVRAQA